MPERLAQGVLARLHPRQGGESAQLQRDVRHLAHADAVSTHDVFLTWPSNARCHTLRVWQDTLLKAICQMAGARAPIQRVTPAEL